MARQTRTVRIEFEGDIDDLRKELEKIPGATKQNVDKAVKELQKKVEFDGIKKGLEELPGVTKAAATKMARELQKVTGDARVRFAGLGDLIKAELSADLIREGVVGFREYVSELQEARVETIRFAEATGIGLDTLAGLELGIKRVGGDFSQVRDSLADFGEVMFDVANNGGRAKEAFELLGVEVRNLETGALRPTDDVLREVLDKLPRVADESVRVAIGQQLMSDSSLEVVAALQKQDLEGYIADARELGVLLDQDLVESTKNWAAANQLVAESFLDLGDAGGILPSMGDTLLVLAVAFDFWKSAAINSIDAVLEKIRTGGGAINQVLAGDMVGALASVDEALRRPTFTDVFDIFNDAAETAAERLRDVRGAIQQTGIETKKVGELEENKEKAAKEADAAAKKRESTRKAEASAAAKRARAAAKAQRERQREEAKAAKEAAALLKGQIDAEVDLHAIQIEARDDLLSAEDEVQRAFLDRIAAIREVESVIGETGDTQKAIDEASARRARELADIRIAEEKRIAEIIKTFDDEIARRRRELLDDFASAATLVGGSIMSSFADLAQAALNELTQDIKATQVLIDGQRQDMENISGESEERIKKLRAEVKDARKEGDKDRVESAQRAIALVKEEGEAEKARIQLEIDEGERSKAFQAKQAIDVFKLQKKLKIAQATFSASVLAIEIATALAATGIGAVGAVPAGVAIAGGALSAQLALINSQEPPTFHVGGVVGPGSQSPDERDIRAQTGEGVINRRGMSNLGEEGLNAINGGMPMSLTVQLVLDGQVIDQRVMRLLRRVQVVSLGTGGRAFRRPAYQGQGV